MLLEEEEEEEWREFEDVLGRRLRLARAVLVLSRAIAAMESRLFLDCGGEGAVASVWVVGAIGWVCWR